MRLIKQLDESDCGPACIAMVCSHFGVNISISKIREFAGTDYNGTTLRGMLEACNQLGFDAKVLKGTEQIISNKFPTPFIAHLKSVTGSSHFIVVSKIYKNKVCIYDPAGRIKKVDRLKFLELWSGYFLIFKPSSDEVFKSKNNELKKFLPLIFQHSKLIFQMIVASLILSLFGILSGLYFRFFIDEIIGTKSLTTLHSLSLLVIVLLILTEILKVIRSQFLRILTTKIGVNLLVGYVKHLYSLPLNFFGTRKIGEILTRFSDSNKIVEVLSKVAMGTFLDCLIMLFVGIFLLITNSKLFFIILISVILSSLIIICLSNFFATNFKNQMESNSNVNSFLVESVSGIEVIKSYNA